MFKFRLKNLRKSKAKKTDPYAVEIARLAQGTPVVGYHDENGHLVIPIEYDDDYMKDRIRFSITDG
jgi:hypothetical protein